MSRSGTLRCSVFLLLMVPVHLLLLAVHDAAAHSRSLLFRVDRLFWSLHEDLDYLVLGDSHAQDDLDPAILGRAFNFASAGETYLQTRAKLKKILRDRSGRIRRVILPLDVHSFSSFRAGRMEDADYWVRYVDFLELGREEGDPLGRLPELIEGQLIPYLGRGKDWLRVLNTLRRSQQVPVRGYLGRKSAAPQSLQKRWALAHRRARLHLGSGEAEDPLLVGAFEDCLDLCAEHGVEILAVKFPVSPEYDQAIRELVDVDTLEEWLTSLVADRDGVKLLDLRRELFDRPHLFADADHLDARGAAVLSHLVRTRGEQWETDG